MAVGFSDGTSHPDSETWLASVDHRTDKQRSDQSEINSDETSGDFQSRFGGAEQRPLVYINPPSTDSTMPLGSPTEPAGAFKSTGGTQTPGNSEKVNFD